MTPFERLCLAIDTGDVTEKDIATMRLMIKKEHNHKRAARTHGMSDQHLIAAITVTYASIDLHHSPCNELQRTRDMQVQHALRRKIKRARQQGFKGATYYHQYVTNQHALGSFPADIHAFLAFLGKKAKPARIVEPVQLVLDPDAAHWRGDTAAKRLKARVEAKSKPKTRTRR